MPRLRAAAGAVLLVVLLALPSSQAAQSATLRAASSGAASILAASPSETLALLAATPRPIRDPAALVGRVTGTTVASVEGSAPAEPLGVGRVDSFWVLDLNANRYQSRQAVLHLVTDRAYWYVEQGRSVDQGGLERSAVQFDQVTYPTVRRHFGSEWSPGIDGDPRISIFIGTVPGVGAYFSNWDEYPRAVFPFSNEREMVHVNLASMPPGTVTFDSTLAHEFQHMVHWNANPAQETWVDEGSAELAAALSVAGRTIGVTRFAGEPDTQLTAWAQGAGTAAHYQAAFLFMQYFAERFGGAEALRAAIAEPGRAPEAFSRYLARVNRALGFDHVFQDWVVANLLDNPTLLDGRFGHLGSDPSMAIIARLAPSNPELSETVHQYGTDYVDVAGDGDGWELHFAGEATVPLVRAEPTSGRQLWWSNRGDGLDTSMTRRFDLRNAAAGDPLTLRFNLWYETEQDFDYLYVMAATDGGIHWQVLRGAHSSDDNRAGNAVGPGYSGRAGDGPGWLAETVDLSPFAGSELLLRFEYVTDQAYNARGALVDDVAIPELGYLDDAESDTGWVYDGWVRSDNTIPQAWGLRLVEYGRDGAVTVRVLAAGPDGTLIEPLPALGRDVERAVLTVSGLAPLTLEQSAYRVALRPAVPGTPSVARTRVVSSLPFLDHTVGREIGGRRPGL